MAGRAAFRIPGGGCGGCGGCGGSWSLGSRAAAAAGRGRARLMSASVRRAAPPPGNILSGLPGSAAQRSSPPNAHPHSGQQVWQGPDSRPEQRVCPAAPPTCYTWTFFGTWIIGSTWNRCGKEELELSTGLQTTSLEQRQGCGGVFRDLLVNTRRYWDHVRESMVGSQGQVVKLFANHFQVTSHPQWVTYKYNVDYTPHIESGSVRANLLFQHQPLIGKCNIFDGSSLLLPHMLSKPKMGLVSKFKDELVKVTIKFSSKLAPTSPDCLHYYYNILFGKILKMMNLKKIGRNYYDGTGQATSILQYENSMTLCADVKHKLLRMETAYDLMICIHDSAKSKNVNVTEQVSKELVGSTVITKFNNRTYRVDASNWKENPKTTFKKSDGTIISLVDYYKEQYNVQVTDVTQPLLISMGKWKKSQQDTSREPILLVPELCYLTGLTDKMHKDYRVMRELALHTRLNPGKRQQELQKFMNAVQKNENVQKELQLWDFRFDTKLLSFSGRILKEEVLVNVSCLYSFKVVCVLSDDRKDRYDVIKKYLCVNHPIPSQCVLAWTLDKPQMLMTIATSIAQQMNCKMGGALWKVQTGLQDAMFIGIDCFHDNVNRQTSVAGFVASINEDLPEWFSQSIFQESGQELVSRLRACLQEAPKRWYERNSCLPRSLGIFVYWDGVGDGHLQALIDYEIPQIVFSLENIYKSPDSKLTFIVVKEQINTRFFVESQERLQNPLPETTVDVELTRREWYDFFIVSQAVKEGTVTPTHYNVIYDTVHLSPDTLQRLIYQLCYMYYNLPAVIHVPASCYYAHKLADLAGQCIHQEPHHSLSNHLFYL
ncbi:LOW QUALITY PROTEIN: piwi-like protein 3 [Saccopteryx bilineata]|uniref:LOW QUALITY PROTEIN: piwi-like protein 3 n=1 Tax=Saccopteryx bilineata TaxID=59482 RepID=UPI00338E6768